jgi:uncharacterized protein YndB with AHSA1/START domain
MSNELSITRVLSATPEEAYEAWLDPRSLMEWMVPIPGGRTEAQTDPRVGGGFLIVMYGDGTRYPTRGEYLRLEKPHLLEFSWYPDGNDAQKSIVTIELKPLGKERTELTLRHRLLPSQESVQGHHAGWSRGLDRLVDWSARKHA